MCSDLKTAPRYWIGVACKEHVMRGVDGGFVEEPCPKGLERSSQFLDFETDMHGSPNSALKGRDCGLADVQVCHGKEGHLKKMTEGDWIIYYSPTFKFGEKEPCRAFTAIGQIDRSDPYPFEEPCPKGLERSSQFLDFETKLHSSPNSVLRDRDCGLADVQMSENFCPYRRNVDFYPCEETAILPLIDKLFFIKDKKRWGFPFRRGCFSIQEADFKVIASEML